MKLKFFKKLSMLIVIFIMSLLITSCGSSKAIMTFTNTTLPDDISKRFSANIDILNELHNAGFITDAAHTTYTDRINEMRNAFLSDSVKISDKGVNGSTKVLSAISKLRTYDWENLGADLYLDDIVTGEDETNHYSVEYTKELGNKYIGNFLVSNAFVYGPSSINGVSVTELNKVIKNSVHPAIKHLDGVTSHFQKDSGLTDAEVSYSTFSYTGNGSKKIEPVEVIPTALQNDIIERLNFEVYVLKSDIFTQDGTGSIDSIMMATKEAFKDAQSFNKDDYAKITNLLSQYFEPLKMNGETVKLIDFSEVDSADLMLVQDSADVDLSNYNTEQKPGNDLVILEEDLRIPLMSIKFHEFNYDAYEKFSSALGINEGKFCFVTGGDDKGRVYILEYPVFAIDELIDTGDKVEATFKESGLGINLYTNRIIKYNIASAEDGKYTFSSKGTALQESVDEYLTVAGADSVNADGKSSFIVKGKANVDYDIHIAGKTKTISADVGRIILRDYLEGTYSPGFHHSDDVVVFGRKIRLMFHDWTGDNDEKAVWNKVTAAAKFVDKNGKDVDSSIKLYITDFCDAKKLCAGDNARIEVIPGKGEVYESVASTSPQVGDYKNIDNLDIHRVSKISPTLLFPSQELDSQDYTSDSNSKQRFWVLTTRRGIFDSGLYSGWINSTSSTASMAWWNVYLSANSMLYQVDQVELQDFLRGNYKSDLGTYGDYILIELEIIEHIKDEMEKEAEQEKNEFINTVFIILGWFMICYSVILIMAWIIDTNADIGIDLLNKLTMGNWLAVKYPEDMPTHDVSGVRYVDASRLMFSVIILITIGILLLSVSIFDLMIVVIEHAGSLSHTLEQLINGSR